MFCDVMCAVILALILGLLVILWQLLILAYGLVCGYWLGRIRGKREMLEQVNTSLDKWGKRQRKKSGSRRSSGHGG